MKGFIFDMDGVVVDNHKFHFQAWMEFATKYKFELNLQIYRDTFNGKTNADLFKMIFGNISPAQVDIYAHEKESNYQKLYEKEMKPLKGLIDFLDYLKFNRYKIALGTSAPTSNVDFTLDKLFLRKYFDVIVDGPQVTRGKPDPEVYLRCATMLDLDPKVCVVFEDSLAGLESGKRAGCEIVGVATSHEAFELKPLTENIIHDFTEARSLFRF
ncbi:MAG: HAD family phosphatase [Bdellovibrionales bacterium]|nr:HAD family phosphatase [Bdellovibrionales bacterium]